MLRCGFLVTSYPRFFRGTERTGPGLEWLQRAGSEGAQRGTAPPARLDRRASLGPVLSAAPMVLEQTWHRGETKVRGAFRPGRPARAAGRSAWAPDTSSGAGPGSRGLRGAGPAPPRRPPARALRLRCAGLARRRAKRKQAQEADLCGGRPGHPCPRSREEATARRGVPEPATALAWVPSVPSPPESRPAPGAGVSAAPAARQAGRGAAGPCFSPANGWTAPWLAAEERQVVRSRKSGPRDLCSQCGGSIGSARGAPRNRLGVPPQRSNEAQNAAPLALSILTS